MYPKIEFHDKEATVNPEDIFRQIYYPLNKNVIANIRYNGNYEKSNTATMIAIESIRGINEFQKSKRNITAIMTGPDGRSEEYTIETPPNIELADIYEIPKILVMKDSQSNPQYIIKELRNGYNNPFIKEIIPKTNINRSGNDILYLSNGTIPDIANGKITAEEIPENSVIYIPETYMAKALEDMYNDKIIPRITPQYSEISKTPGETTIILEKYIPEKKHDSYESMEKTIENIGYMWGISDSIGLIPFMQPKKKAHEYTAPDEKMILDTGMTFWTDNKAYRQERTGEILVNDISYLTEDNNTHMRYLRGILKKGRNEAQRDLHHDPGTFMEYLFGAIKDSQPQYNKYLDQLLQ